MRLSMLAKAESPQLVGVPKSKDQTTARTPALLQGALGVEEVSVSESFI
jgi:hypothetical protein